MRPKRTFLMWLATWLAVLALAACTRAATPLPTPLRPASPPPALPATQAATAPTAAPATQAPAAATAATQATAIPSVAPAPPARLDDSAILAAVLRPGAAVEAGGLTRYRLDVALAPDLGAATGRAEIRYTNREAETLDAVYLNLYPNLWDGGMAVKDAKVRGKAVSPGYPAGDDVLRLPVEPPLAPGDVVEVTLDFAIAIPGGEGVGNYGEFALQEGVLAMAHFYPTVAVFTEGRWQTETPSQQGDVIFHDASLYDVTLTAPADLTVVATGATLERSARGDGMASWHLAGGPMRDFNIAASALYRSAGTKAGDVTVTSYYLPEDEAGGRQALEWAAAALRVYEEAFGPYPYRELDVAATGTAAGGIEYPGLIIIARRLYSDPERIQFFESATTHEVAHQWWYNVVGNDQLDDPWLDEALAQYSTYLYFRSAYGEPGGRGFLEAMNGRWDRVARAEKPIGLPMDQYVDAEYSAIVYGRGPLFFVALRDRMGEEKMVDLLRRYYREQQWDIATPEEFQALAEETAGEELDDLFDAWVYPRE